MFDLPGIKTRMPGRSERKGHGAAVQPGRKDAVKVTVFGQEDAAAHGDDTWYELWRWKNSNVFLYPSGDVGSRCLRCV